MKSAVTANQSAIAPTIDASAPAFTNPSQPSCPRVTTYTRAASTSRLTASVRMRRRPRGRACVGQRVGRDHRDRGHGAILPDAPIAARMPAMADPRPARTVITFGTFDVFHVGHLRVIERAAALGDRLVVGVSADALNLSKKGREPVFSQAERLAIVAALKPVDEVFVEESLELKRHYIEQWG